ncbi:MAG TPA: VacJ family lipoprotein [Thermodesulfobacteriota bacterium]|nr:VacJ family lipoprotein [Thermodesulfobacteriota bacterium]
MKVSNDRRLTLPRKRLRAEGTIKSIHTVSLALLVLCFSMIPNLCFGESWISLHAEEAVVSIQTEKEAIQTDKEIAQNFPMAPSEPAEEETGAEETGAEETGVKEIPDPLGPMNRAFFKFNDKLYFWFFKPVATGYKAIVPEDGRIGIRNFFSNLATPVRLVNCLLQAKFKGAGNEGFRFLLNSTFGLLGFLDLAKRDFNVDKEDRDFGQTLGVWGMGPSFYLNWPLLGPSNLRDTFGFIGDLALDPRTYVFKAPLNYLVAGAKPMEAINNISFRIGEYEDFKKAALDPYVAVRNAYSQHREQKIKNR